MSSPYRILLVGYKDGDTSGEIPGLFARSGVCSVESYCSSGSWLRKSRYSRVWHPANTEDPALFIYELVVLSRAVSYDWIVFTDDDALRAAYDHLEEDDRWMLPVNDAAYRPLAGSKVALSRLSAANGLRTPLFAVHDGKSDIRTTAKAVPFPLLLKVDRSGGGKGIFYCSDEPSLRKAFSSLSLRRRKDLLLQSYVAGENISVEALYRNGMLIASAPAKVIRNMDSEFGVSAVREYKPDAALEKELENIGKALCFNGFCSFTFMHTPETGAYYLVEADLRTHAWFSLARFAGVDFSEAIRWYLEGVPGRMQQPEGTVHLRHFSRDIIWSVRNGDVKNLFAWAINYQRRWQLVPSHDLHLLVTTAKHIATSLTNHMLPVRIVRFAMRFLRSPRSAIEAFSARYPAVRAYASYIADERKQVVLSLLLSCTTMLVFVPIPFIIKDVFDQVLPTRDMPLLLGWLGLMALLLAAGTLLALANRHRTLTTSKSIISALRKRLLDRSLALGQAFYATEDLDAVHSRIVHDTERIDRMTNALLAQILPAALVTASLSVVLAYLNPLLFLVMSIVLPLLYAGGRIIGRKLRQRARHFHERYAEFSKGVFFTLKFNELIALSGAERIEFERQERNIESLQRASFKMAWLGAVYGAVQSNILTLGSVIVLIVGGLQVMQGSVTLGSILSFYATLTLLSSHVKTVLNTVPVVIEGTESLAGLAPFLSRAEPAETHAPTNTCGYPIVFENVTFGYGPSFSLTDVSFSIQEGRVVGIFGASGSGKSTIIRLLLGLHTPDQGRILVAGRDLRECDLASYRASIGVLPQDPLLFPGTIRENLTYGLIDPDEDAMILACRLSKIHDFICGLEDGYDTDVGNRAMAISGGQKQRIAIARALLRKPQLIILDEPDNNLDDVLIREILDGIRSLGVTVLLISHNAALQEIVDETLFVRDGTVRVQQRDAVLPYVAKAFATSLS